MQYGVSIYAHELSLLVSSGLPTIFTQTGGMCPALEVKLETGQTLLITDFAEPLPWDRQEQRGWRVGLYPPPDVDDQEPLRDAGVEDTSAAALLALVRQVLSPRATNP